MSRRQFNNVKLPRVPRNNFNLSHERRMSADMFYLYPVLVEDCIPGDIWSLANDIVIRSNPLATPIMSEINLFVHYYFVPYRLLWKDFEKFITGGQDGSFVSVIPFSDPLAWDSNSPGVGITTDNSIYGVGGIMDYLGFNPVATPSDYGKVPNFFPIAAYNFIWHEYYRDQNIIPAREEASVVIGDVKMMWKPIRQERNNAIDKGLEKRAWEKDYFTSMLPWQQRGTSPGISITGLTSAVFPTRLSNAGGSGTTGNFSVISRNGYQEAGFNAEFTGEGAGGFRAFFEAFLQDNTVDLSKAIVDTDVSDLRLSFQIQKFLERNARTGVRYVEFLKAHFPAYPRDDRLDRPEYIGGSKTPVIISEVLQTSQSNPGAPQGNMAGHGLSADRTRVAKYRVQEFGLIMGIMSIMPRTMYQDGIDRVWLKESKYDFYFPEFANLSEQAVYTPELWNYNPQPVDKVMGYQGRYDEYRYKRNSVHGLFRDDFDKWHLGRKFASAPTLNADLLYPNADELWSLKQRALAVPEQPMFMVAINNRNSAIRPLPFIAEPGLVDHG